MSIDLPALWKAAQESGWAVGTGSLLSLKFAASGAHLGWREVPTRKGDPCVAELRPTEKSSARRRSLSAIYGLGGQPLHTDGAHLADPPDLIILHAGAPNGTPTLLRKVDAYRDYERLSHGVFLVDNGPESFYATVRSEVGIRFDPGCMIPCDQRSREVVKFFEESINDAHSHTWTGADQFLLVDNRRVLHARAAVSPGDESRILHRIAIRTRRDG